MCTGIAAPRQCRQPARSMVLPLVCGRPPPLWEEPPGRVQPRPDTWLARQGCEVYLGTHEPARDSRGPTSRRVAPGLESWLLCVPAMRLGASTLRPQVPALERAQPPLVCQVAMSWSRLGVRAGEPVRAPESRCSGAPLLTRKQFARETVRPVVGSNREGDNHK